MTQIRIPLAKPSFDNKEIEGVRRVLESGWVVQGPEVQAFEHSIASLHKVRHCIAVTSGTAALHVGYLALGIGPGDLVFIPSFAWPSAANMASLVGARPILVDVLEDTYNIDVSDLGRKIEQCKSEDPSLGQPKAIVAVHQFGLPADMEGVRRVADEYSLEIIEDAACALGAECREQPVGNFGKMGIFSFHPRKAATTGEGGAIVTNSDDLDAQCRIWRNHGQYSTEGIRDFGLPGLNYRLTEIQAAIGRSQLDKFPELLRVRRDIVREYLEILADCPGVRTPEPSPEHTWQTFMVVLDDRFDRKDVIKALAQKGIGAGAGSISAHCLKFYNEQYGYKSSDLPVSEKLHKQGLALPLYAEMTSNDLQECARALQETLR